MANEDYSNSIPTLSVDLINELARDVPALRLKPSDPMPKVWFKAGARDLVDTLLERLENTNDLAIEGESSIHV